VTVQIGRIRHHLRFRMKAAGQGSAKSGRAARPRQAPSVSGRRSPEEVSRILLFNLLFFGSLAWLGSAADVSHSNGWWYGRGQIALALVGIILFWIAWWFDGQGLPRPAIGTVVPAIATMSVWFSSVHSAL
jgi:hypothetical protein